MIAGSLMMLITTAFAVRSSLDPLPEPLLEVTDTTSEVRAAPTLDLFLELRYDPVILDEFSRASEGLGTTDTGQQWVDSGDWATTGSTATLQNRQSLGPSIALVEGPPGERLVGGQFDQISGGAGLVYGYLDIENYWAVVATPQFALWQIWQVSDGVASLVGRIGPPVDVAAGTEIALHIRNDSVDYYIDGRQLLTLNHSINPQATAVGMIALREGPFTASWDRFAVAADVDG